MGAGAVTPSHAERPALVTLVGPVVWVLSVLRLFLRLSFESSSRARSPSLVMLETFESQLLKDCGSSSLVPLWLLVGRGSFALVFAVEEESLEGVGLAATPNSTKGKLGLD